MVTAEELKSLVERARNRGAIIRCHVSDGAIQRVSIGKEPGGDFRALGQKGSEWMGPILAAERLREILSRPAEA